MVIGWLFLKGYCRDLVLGLDISVLFGWYLLMVWHEPYRVCLVPVTR